MQDDTYSPPQQAQIYTDWSTDPVSPLPRPLYLVQRPEEGILEGRGRRLFIPDVHFDLVLVERGCHSWRGEQGEATMVNHPTMYLVPSGAVLHLESQEVEGACSYQVFAFRPHPNLCQGICPSKRERQPHAVKGDAPRPRRHAPQVTALPLSPTLIHWAETVRRYLQCGEEVSIHMFDFKLQELFVALRLDYAQALVDEFLTHYHCRISGFRSLVLSSYHRTMEVQDLYALSSELGVNELAFKRSFHEEFGMPPREWITLQRARYIYCDLVETSKSIRTLSEEYGFCSLSYFSLFCKENLGETPLQIRKRSNK